MPLNEGYGILKGIAVETKTERDDKQSPHYQIFVEADSKKYRIPVNVKSIQQPFDLLVKIDLDFKHPITAELVKLKSGYTEIPVVERKAGGMALDYIRMNLAKKETMRPIRADLEGRENDLNDFLDGIILPILNDSSVDIYAFGEPFSSGLGIHNIHMNQGNREAKFAKENGVYQDGALLIHFTNENRWVSYFSAFQSQSFHTDNQTGNPLDNQGNDIDDSTGIDDSVTIVANDIKIIAALVNPSGDDVGKETITLLNVTSNTINLQGWSLADRLKRKMPLSGSLLAGETIRILISSENIQLSNNGGIITLLNPNGLKVDGVSYTKNDVKEQGKTIVF